MQAPGTLGFPRDTAYRSSVTATDNRCDYRLLPPASPDEWETYHRIRRDVLLEARKHALEHPDELAPGHHPLLLWLGDRAVGTIRVDILPAGRAGVRLVAIDPALQHQGHGRALLALAEAFARGAGCTRTVVYSTPDAEGFYAKAGYAEEEWDDRFIAGIVQMAKRIA
jgi:GNAT superfamily N-acetyltransferase